MCLKRLIFIRHGESSANAKDIISSDINLFPLTPKGKEQVEFVAGQISALKINTIYSSPLLRARQTADILSKKTNTEIRIIEELRRQQEKLGSIHVISAIARQKFITSKEKS